MRLKVLILGGTSEGRLLGEQLERDLRYQTLLSFAGRTERLVRPASEHRVGGFGGAEGLARFLREHEFTALIDATHAFAAQISANAVRAANLTGVPLLRVTRPAWQPQAGDLWREVVDMEAAVDALGSTPRRVFLTIGRLEAAAFQRAAQHDYLLRAIDSFDPGLPRARVIAARGPFDRLAEQQLLERERIELLVTKNAGTIATYAKIAAARALSIPVVMVARPFVPAAEERDSVAGALAWLDALHAGASSERGE
jgi:precorrin-6A/cobalt-precorrin-6A reductase